MFPQAHKQNQQKSQLLYDIPKRFWIENPQEHLTEIKRVGYGNCCLNHYLGLPEKAGRQFPIFDWQMELIYKRLFRHRHLAINKFTGAGMTSISPRLFLDISYNHKPKYSQFAVVTGTNLSLAIQILQQFIKPVIDKKHPELIKSSIKEQIILSNDTYIKAYPTDHIDSLRGQKDLELVFVDEAAFFHPNQQEDIRMAIERNEGKTDPWVIYNSTPNGPTGVFYNIFNDALKSKNDYDPIMLNYTLGLQYDFLDRAKIAKMQRDNPRLFEQEFNNKFIQPMGSVMPDISNTEQQYKAVEL